jgi:OOP family OmpA-OmpF porin
LDKPFLNIIFLILNSLVFGQNLVPNGSFEESNWCPSYADGFYVEAAKYWSNPTLGTSDYFHSCSTDYDTFQQRFMFSVPQNYVGDQDARTGNAYAGFSYTQVDDPQLPWLDQIYSEYMQVELIHELTAGKFYDLQFYVSNAFTSICGNSVGALFVNTEMNQPHQTIIQQQPQVQSDLNVFFCDSTKWFEIRKTFQATGGERFLIIGVFTPLYQMQTSDYNGNIISGPGQFGANEYLYVDDVSLTETSIELPNIFTPNNDGSNDVFSVDVLKTTINEIRILNRWGEVVYSSTDIFQWDGKLPNGNECSEGVYYYTLKTKNDIIFQGFISLMR